MMDLGSEAQDQVQLATVAMAVSQRELKRLRRQVPVPTETEFQESIAMSGRKCGLALGSYLLPSVWISRERLLSSVLT